MAGYTNLPFRVLIRKIAPGVDRTVTELVNARSLIETNREALKLVATSPEDQPCSIQLFGNVVAEMAEAARILEGRGALAVNINMGCPAPKVFKNGGGSALLAHPAEARALAQAVVQAVKIPVTVKMRLGVEEGERVAPELAYAFQESGVQCVTIHGRTRVQGFSGSVDVEGIAAVVAAAPRIPVLANGDVTTLENARWLLQKTGAAGLSIGRGALFNPWIFKEIRQGIPHPPSFEERLDFMTQHLQAMVELYGETPACSQFRKITPFYTRRMGPSREVNRRLCQCTSLALFQEIMEQYRQERGRFLDETGQLKESYQPVPVHSSLGSNL